MPEPKVKITIIENGYLVEYWSNHPLLKEIKHFDNWYKMLDFISSLHPKSKENKKIIETDFGKKNEIRQAVARGWCHPKNERKDMDTALAEAILDEVWETVKKFT